MLKVLTVYRYQISGRLVATGLPGGNVLPLNSDLSFSEKEVHRVRRDTPLDSTPYRIEVEIHGNLIRAVRTWDERRLPTRSNNPADPLEARIDISPSEELGQAERQYVGQSAGHPLGFWLIGLAFLLLYLIGVWGWWPPIVALVTGVALILVTKTDGDPQKIAEVRQSKTRLRQLCDARLHEAMRDVHQWMGLDGIGFERAVAKIYRDKGFDVQLTPRTNDQGVDLILRREGRTSIVQCKAYASPVGVGAVRELVGTRASWPHADEAVLVTLFGCTKAAKVFAAQHGVKLYSVAGDFLQTDYKPIASRQDLRKLRRTMRKGRVIA